MVDIEDLVMINYLNHFRIYEIFQDFLSEALNFNMNRTTNPMD